MYFAPDHSGIALYASDFARYAVEQGHEVKVVTGFSFYPSWKKSKSDEGRLFATEDYAGAKIYRGYMYVPRQATALKRILSEISFLLFAAINFLRAGKSDAIVVFTTPVLLGVLAAIFALFGKRKLIINVQDFQVEAAESLGLVKASAVLKVLEGFERWSYKRADKVATISSGMLDVLKGKGFDFSTSMYWPNWVNVSDFHQERLSGEFRKKYDVPLDAKVLAYAGNIGNKQGLSVLVDIADQLQTEDELKFFIIGAGAGLSALSSYANDKSLPNLKILDFLSQEDYQQMLADVDAIFISQEPVEKDIYFPSKLLGVMAARKFVVVMAGDNSELHRVVSSRELGMVKNFGDIDGLAADIKLWVRGDIDTEAYKVRAEQYVSQMDRQPVLRGVLTQLQQLIDKED